MLQAEYEPSEVALASTLDGLDRLSVRFMVEGFTTSTLAELSGLAEQARETGSHARAEQIANLVADLQTSSGEEADALLKKGMTDLRALIGQEETGTAPSSAPAYAALGDDAELVADFLIEAREHLSLIEGQMLSLERDPTVTEIIHAVFRAFHTIKGLAGFLGFPVMQQVAHEIETLLDLARNEKLLIDSPVVDVVLESADFLLGEMASLDRVLAGAPSVLPADNSALIAKIKRLAVTSDNEAIAPPVVAARKEPSAPTAAPSETPAATTKAIKTRQASPKAANRKTKAVSAPTPAPTATKNTEVSKPLASIQDASAAPEVDDFFFPAPPLPLAAALVPEIVPPAAQVHAPKPQPVKAAETPRPAEHAKLPDSGSVRVETAKLDHLMDMVGEMVIAQSLIRHNQVLLSTTDSRLVGDLSHLARVTAEVQRATMSMRMVPVAQLFQKIERVIRDLSRKAGKQVVLLTSGTDTEVDKTVAEELSDPLLHMVRNSVDHGIETPEERLAAGKSPIAQIKLSAYHQGGQVVIEISDDGRGLNAEKIRAKAEQKEIIHAGAQLTEAEIHQLIFAPGFSTAETITDVSGRGVGMDVVRRNVEKLRGRIETLSTLGAGTTFLLKLPLTLAIIDGLVVEVGSNHYIVPLSVVREIFRPLESAIFSVGGREEMAFVREQLLPIVRLNQRLGVESRVTQPSEGLLVVIESENKLYCLLVDDLLGKQEVVIKSLGETFQDASGFSGCAVLGNGRVGLILDTDGIYRGRRR
jgi:two-component system chemotaxis sensor kinase CheA